MHENDINDILKRVRMTFNNKMYQRRIQTSDKKWIDENINDIFDILLSFLETLIYVEI